MDKTALLVVDVQTVIIEDHPYHEKELISNINQLLTKCRSKDIEVIYVRHDSGVGSEAEKNTRGWQIYEEIAPIPGEKIIDKIYNSAFRSTGLKEYLDEKGIHTLILVGMMTEYCIDVTCKVGFEYGYNIIIPEDTTTTLDNEYLTAEATNNYFIDNIWNNRYAKVKSMKEVLEMCINYK